MSGTTPEPEHDRLVAAGSTAVRAFLASRGMADEDITECLVQARTLPMSGFRLDAGEPEAGPMYTLVFADDVFRLTVEEPA
jgi:hypothetical protein